MKFEVYNRKGDPVMATEYPECIPFNSLDSMSKSGHYFLIDGKKKSKKSILDEFEDYSNSSINDAKIKIIHSKQIRCVDTGNIYNSQAEAARELGIDPAQVSDSIKTGRPRSGYTFERVKL